MGEKVKFILPYLLLIVGIAAIIYLGRSICMGIYANGVEAGKAELRQAIDQERVIESKRQSQEKEEIEQNAQAKIEAAKADRANALATSDRLRTELDKVRDIARDSGLAFSTGTSTGQVISMLADMLEESNRNYIATAGEADDYYIAGKTCEAQYDSLRNRYEKSQNTARN